MAPASNQMAVYVFRSHQTVRTLLRAWGADADRLARTTQRRFRRYTPISGGVARVEQELSVENARHEWPARDPSMNTVPLLYIGEDRGTAAVVVVAHGERPRSASGRHRRQLPSATPRRAAAQADRPMKWVSRRRAFAGSVVCSSSLDRTSWRILGFRLVGHYLSQRGASMTHEVDCSFALARSSRGCGASSRRAHYREREARGASACNCRIRESSTNVGEDGYILNRREWRGARGCALKLCNFAS